MKPLNLKHKAFHFLITGRSSTGKTTLAQRIIETESAHELVFIFDPELEFFGRFGEKHTVLTDKPDGLGVEPKPRIQCFAPPEDSDWQAAFDDFCFYCWTYAGEFNGAILMVVDELQDYVNDSILPQSFKDCLAKGRRRQLDMLLISQQPNFLHNSIRTQTTESAAFAQSDELAVKFNKNLGFDVDAVMDLPDLTYFRKRVGAPAKKYQISFDKK